TATHTLSLHDALPISGTFAQPISFFGAAQTATAGAVVCLLGGRYELPCTIYIRNSGTSSAWITFKSNGDGDVLMVWKGGLTCGRSEEHTSELQSLRHL